MLQEIVPMIMWAFVGKNHKETKHLPQGMALLYKKSSFPKFGRATLVLRTHFNYDLTKGKEKNLREAKKKNSKI